MLRQARQPGQPTAFERVEIDIRLSGGGRFDCESLRDGCPGMVARDGYAGDYSYAKIDTSPDTRRR